ncbi:hypothetical protein [Glycomyces sp. NRRL B-16210]|uniref:hypothetical protein n=1 Tax=Glycomyces sp. NRRL B-16210 TaxID=1463821 RepID=UPI0004C0C39B|nr:hypothetical protein [Glycomyces sp. NRRL B-16210]
MSLPDEDLRVVEARPEAMSDLWEKEEQLDSYGLAAYAKEIGLAPPEGFWSVEIVVAFPENGPEDGVLAWLGPDTSGQGDDQ